MEREAAMRAVPLKIFLRRVKLRLPKKERKRKVVLKSRVRKTERVRKIKIHQVNRKLSSSRIWASP